MTEMVAVNVISKEAKAFEVARNINIIKQKMLKNKRLRPDGSLPESAKRIITDDKSERYEFKYMTSEKKLSYT